MLVGEEKEGSTLFRSVSTKSEHSQESCTVCSLVESRNDVYTGGSPFLHS